MKRRAVLSMLLAVALMLGAVSPFGPSKAAAEEMQTNLALGKTVTASSSYVGSGWSPARAVDGQRTGVNTASGDKGWTSTPVASNPGTEWLTVDLGASYSMDKVVLWPRNDQGQNVGMGFPASFNIKVSTDNLTWTTVANETNYPAPVSGGAQTFSFSAANARYVKVEGTVLSKDVFQAYVMQLAEVEIYPVPTVQANLALNKPIEASSSYVGSGWRPELAVDGVKIGSNTATGDKGWTSQPKSSAPASEWIMVDLGYVDRIDKVVLWPRNDEGQHIGSGFPIDFTIKASTDKTTWTTVATKTDYPAPSQAGGQAIGFTSAYARYVKIEATELSKDDFNAYVMQLAELEVLQAISQLTDQEAVDAGHQWLTLTGTTNIYTNMTLPTFSMENTQVTWASSHPAYLRGDGKLMNRPAWNEGALTVTLTATVKKGTASKTKDFPVTLKPYPNVAPEAPNTFKVAVFWPPTKDYVNAQQYDYLQEANVNFIEVVETGDLTSVEVNDRMLDLAGERGMKVSVTNTEDLSSVSDHEVEEFVNHFKPHPATGGYFIRDEPVAFKDFHDSARLYKKVKEMDPARLAHLNLLPGSDHWATWTGLVGAENIEFLTFDSYPFGINGMGQDFYYLLDRIRKLGLKNNYKTAGYLQSVGIDNRLIRPTPEIIRYEVYLNLAYGLKKLTWFTWWTPTNRGEPFTTAIITADGQKTDLFEPVKQMNSVMLKLGTTLLNLDAKDVYHYGQIPENTVQLPSSFYFQPVSAPNSGDDMVISNFVHKDTGRRYVMVVNKSMTTSKNFTFAINSTTGITSVTEVSNVTGAEIATNFNPATSQLSASFQPGEGRLYAMPETFIRHYPALADVSQLNNPSPDNLAFGKKAVGSTDTGVEWGWNAPFAIDGKRNSTQSSYGWSNSLDLGVNHTEWITIDLGSTQQIGAVSLFPRTDQWHEGTGFPVDYTVQVSSDNVNWTTVHTTQDYTERPATRRNITFPSVNARYVKVEATELGKDNYNNFRMQFAEVEVYKDAAGFSNLRAKQLPSDLYVGAQSTLTLGRLQTDGTLQTISGQTSFSSSNPSVASVNAQGVVTGVAAGTTTIAVTVPGAGGGTETKSFAVTVRQFAAPWSVSFIGGADGKADVQPNGSYRIQASGSGTGQTSEQFVFVNKTVNNTVNNTSPVTLTSNIESLRYAGAGISSGKTGIMLRSAGTAPQPSSVLLSVNAEGRTELSYRNSSGTITTINGDYVKLPVELKLEKQANTVTGYYKKGTSWVPIKTNAAQSSVTVSFTGTLTGGLASYSSVSNSFSDAVASIS
ncbi:discoidin domain-containing protein [Paenibacillus pasadenensis]|uniref:discoidin domain-containing protein n=1 Tax=Paenibacillus pasadenensis TaxID=217090 RepID=UPI00203F5F6E|nr:discoidin domain-containing protein [Paenibacillus pasadenensis]MCM3747029.1 discoidin domain-containing protein [Paenibacillus pasadenensis]